MRCCIISHSHLPELELDRESSKINVEKVERESHEDGCIEGHRRHRIEDLSEQGVEGLKHRAERSVAVGKKVMRHVAADTVAPRRTLSRS